MSLVESLERAAEALPTDADSIHPANGDPSQLLRLLDAAAASRVLAWLLGNAPDEADELAAAWLEEPAGAAALSSLSEAGLPKAGRKVLRRALHRARSRGIDVSQGEIVTPKVARLPTVDEKIDAGFVSPFDPRGARLVYLVESRPGGGARVCEALLDLQRGIADFQVYQAGRRQVRDFVRDVTHRERMQSVETPPSAVRALIARHVELQPEGQALPRAFNENRSHVLKDADTAATPAALAREALGDAHEEAGIDELVQAIEDREVGPWPPPTAQLNALVIAIRDEAVAVRDEEGEADALERLEADVREMVATQYRVEMAAQLAERFEELAYMYWKRDREALARACLATASSFLADASASRVADVLCRLLSEALLADLRPYVASESSTADGADHESTESNNKSNEETEESRENEAGAGPS
jgi:hypothetical protein